MKDVTLFSCPPCELNQHSWHIDGLPKATGVAKYQGEYFVALNNRQLMIMYHRSCLTLDLSKITPTLPHFR